MCVVLYSSQSLQVKMLVSLVTGRSRAYINTYYFQPNVCVETVWDCFSMCCWSWIPANCFCIYSTCWATGSYTENLCVISALLMLCPCRALKSFSLWNKTPCFLPLPLPLAFSASLFISFHRLLSSFSGWYDMKIPAFCCCDLFAFADNQ